MSAAPASATSPSPTYLPVRQDWLDRHKEPILEPDLPIIDPHHHLWDRPGWRYMFDELLADTNSGHNILATVYVQARAMYRATGPEELRPVGETEWVASLPHDASSVFIRPGRGSSWFGSIATETRGCR